MSKLPRGIVKQGRQDDGDGHDTDEVRSEGPDALRCPAEKECRDVPGSPDTSQDQAGPKRRELTL